MRKRLSLAMAFLLVSSNIVVMANPNVVAEVQREKENKEFNKYIKSVTNNMKNYEKYKEKKRKEEEKKRKKLEWQRKVIKPHYNPNNITELSGLNPKSLELMLNGHWKWKRLKPFIPLLLELEKKYDVNVVFAISIFGQESGWLDMNNPLVEDFNNISGTKNMNRGSSNMYHYFSSIEECIRYTFKNIGEHYVKRDKLKSVYDIAPIYCEDGIDTWSPFINQIAYELTHSKTLLKEYNKR